jgi:hypothetical protein
MCYGPLFYATSSYNCRETPLAARRFRFARLKRGPILDATESPSNFFSLVGSVIAYGAISTLPPAGEGARRADEGLIASPVSEALTGIKALIRPSATFSQGEKGEIIRDLSHVIDQPAKVGMTSGKKSDFSRLLVVHNPQKQNGPPKRAVRSFKSRVD